MIPTKEALDKGFNWEGDDKEKLTSIVYDKLHPKATIQSGFWSFKFGDGYELCFEPLIWDDQMYVALYKDFQLLTEKVVVKPGYIENE